MIIACEQCETRFQLDESRIPAKGARVRCSRCKHAFFVRRPDASAEAAVDEVVAEVTGPGASSAPPATRDLDPSAGDPPRAALGGEDFEADWEFNDEPAAGGLEQPPTAPAQPPQAAAPHPVPDAASPASQGASDALEEEDDLDALGNPEEWNLLADMPAAAAPTAEDDADADPLEELLGAPARSEAPPAGEAVTAATAAETAPAPETEERRPRSLPGLGGALAGLGWAAGLALVGLALSTVVGHALRPPRAAAPGARVVEIAGLGTAREVRGTFLENALSGPLFVVSGRLDAGARAAGRGVEVQLTGPDGGALPQASAWAGTPLSELQLRELAPEVLRDALAGTAGPLVLTGGGRFHAVFQEVPPDAVDFSLRARPLPSTSPPPSPAPSSE